MKVVAAALFVAPSDDPHTPLDPIGPSASSRTYKYSTECTRLLGKGIDEASESGVKVSRHIRSLPDGICRTAAGCPDPYVEGEWNPLE